MAPPIAASGDPFVLSDRPTTEDWNALIQRAALGGPLGQFARQTTLLGVDGGVMRLALKSAHDFASAPMVSQLEQKLGAVLAQRVRIRFEAHAGDAESPAEQHLRNETSRREAAEEAMRRDPVVQSLVDTFDARIVAGSVRPAGPA
jgi:DNA polymerase III subunit gamma/tau